MACQGQPVAHLDGSVRTYCQRLLAAYLRYATTHYVRGNKAATEVNCIKDAMRHARSLDGSRLVSDFGPLALKAVQQSMVRHGVRLPSPTI